MPLTAKAVSFTLCPYRRYTAYNGVRGFLGHEQEYPRPITTVRAAGRTESIARRYGPPPYSAAASSGSRAGTAKWERPKRTPWTKATHIQGSGSLALSVPFTGSEGWMLNLHTRYVFLGSKKQRSQQFLLSFRDTKTPCAFQGPSFKQLLSLCWLKPTVSRRFR